MELTVWDYDTIGSNDFLGGIRLGMGTGECMRVRRRGGRGGDGGWEGRKGREN